VALNDYRIDMESCCKCSLCRFIPMERITGFQHVNICPSVARYNFNAFSAGGRLAMAVALLDERFDYTNDLLDVVYNCQMCGACDTSCKYANDIEVFEPLTEFRIKCVEDGHSNPALDEMVNSLQKFGTMVPGTRSRKGEWAEDLELKDYTKQKTEVIYHAGCRICSDNRLWKVPRATISLLRKAGIDIGIAGNNEPCCGGRAYYMGYKDVFLRQAEKSMALFKEAKAKTLLTSCSECYNSFKVLYDKFDIKGDLEVLHVAEYLDRLIKGGRLRPGKEVKAAVTYHDPCHLGRLGEPFIHWEGKELPGASRLFDPPREFMRGTYGIYEPPRDVLRSIPGLKLVEMDRIKEYSWCCGAGGGVMESNPAYAAWTARERINEAMSTGAEAIVTACPGCELSFKTAIKINGNDLKVYDIVELLETAIE
jgi:Fe-S oxidoreductase